MDNNGSQGTAPKPKPLGMPRIVQIIFGVLIILSSILTFVNRQQRHQRQIDDMKAMQERQYQQRLPGF